MGWLDEGETVDCCGKSVAKRRICCVTTVTIVSIFLGMIATAFVAVMIVYLGWMKIVNNMVSITNVIIIICTIKYMHTNTTEIYNNTNHYI